ncbi:MAG TPA: hypothetical protein VFG69_09525 [Nannocystaceae bacterium]|nr:hypothetical protein [Nannocystaceae bacterium]
MAADDHDEPDVDPDRAAILARRQRFIALALSGLAAAACDTCEPKPCLNISAPQPNDDDADAKTGEPHACLAAMPPADPKAPPHPCLDVEPTPKPCLEVAPTPKPCLEVAPDPKPKPQACLSRRPAKRDDEP